MYLFRNMPGPSRGSYILTLGVMGVFKVDTWSDTQTAKFYLPGVLNTCASELALQNQSGGDVPAILS